MFFTAFVLCFFVIIQNLKQKAKQYTENLTAKFQSSNQKSRLKQPGPGALC